MTIATALQDEIDHPDDQVSSRKAMRCLWLAREVPFPINSGDRAYSGNLAAAFAQAGVELHFLGLSPSEEPQAPAGLGIRWIQVAQSKRPYPLAIFSRYPLVTAAHATARHRHALKKLLLQRWDAIVLDHYGSGWTLDPVIRHLRTAQHRPIVVHVSHNHEEALSHSLYRSYQGSPLRRLALYQNHVKIRHLERKLLHRADLITAITDEDRQAYSRVSSARQQFLVLPPGFSGWKSPPREISNATPKHVVLIGSFRWIVKTENLRSVVKIMDPIFHRNGITLNVVGDVPEHVLEEFRPIVRACNFLGFVDDVTPYLQNARIALVPEVVGGGFKLKMLDYIFGRVPVATISEAAAGLPGAIQENMLMAGDLEALAEQIVANIHNFVYLNRIQDNAFSIATNQYNWIDRGRDLKNAIGRIAGLREASSSLMPPLPLRSGGRA